MARKWRYPNDSSDVHLGDHLSTERERDDEIGDERDVGQVRLRLERLGSVDADGHEANESKRA